MLTLQLFATVRVLQQLHPAMPNFTVEQMRQIMANGAIGDSIR